TIEEVAQVNPYAIISSLRSRYKARYLGNAAQRTVVLTPAMPDLPITRAEIKFDANGYPHRMKLNFPSGQDLTITVSSVKLGTTLPAATFRFKSSDIPGAEVVDLR
ncbi:MAG: outer membrane lipoprotein carrier protein LolA, partial [Paramuribaculum sp.]|nr:outer membrane lipoprotein carrier protein LolA [Paramuribaculum sp.]